MLPIDRNIFIAALINLLFPGLRVDVAKQSHRWVSIMLLYFIQH